MPSSLYADKPDVGDMEFRRVVWGDDYGAGRPPTAAGDFFIDFGLPGVAVGALLIGIAARALIGLIGGGSDGRRYRVTLFAILTFVLYEFVEGTFSIALGFAITMLIPLLITVHGLGRLTVARRQARRRVSARAKLAAGLLGLAMLLGGCSGLGSDDEVPERVKGPVVALGGRCPRTAGRLPPAHAVRVVARAPVRRRAGGGKYYAKRRGPDDRQAGPDPLARGPDARPDRTAAHGRHGHERRRRNGEGPARVGRPTRPAGRSTRRRRPGRSTSSARPGRGRWPNATEERVRRALTTEPRRAAAPRRSTSALRDQLAEVGQRSRRAPMLGAQLVAIPVAAGELEHSGADLRRIVRVRHADAVAKPGCAPMSRAPPRSAATTGVPLERLDHRDPEVLLADVDEPGRAGEQARQLLAAAPSRAAPRSAAARPGAAPRAAPRRPSSAAGRQLRNASATSSGRL